MGDKMNLRKEKAIFSCSSDRLERALSKKVSDHLSPQDKAFKYNDTSGSTRGF